MQVREKLWGKSWRTSQLGSVATNLNRTSTPRTRPKPATLAQRWHGACSWSTLMMRAKKCSSSASNRAVHLNAPRNRAERGRLRPEVRGCNTLQLTNRDRPPCSTARGVSIKPGQGHVAFAQEAKQVPHTGDVRATWPGLLNSHAANYDAQPVPKRSAWQRHTRLGLHAPGSAARANSWITGDAQRSAPARKHR